MQLDVPYLREQILPALARRFFIHQDGDSYRVAVVSVSVGTLIASGAGRTTSGATVVVFVATFEMPAQLGTSSPVLIAK